VTIRIEFNSHLGVMESLCLPISPRSCSFGVKCALGEALFPGAYSPPRSFFFYYMIGMLSHIYSSPTQILNS